MDKAVAYSDLIAKVETVSRAGAPISVQRIRLTDKGKRGLALQPKERSAIAPPLSDHKSRIESLTASE
jgi:hypothetical protein